MGGGIKPRSLPFVMPKKTNQLLHFFADYQRKLLPAIIRLMYPRNIINQLRKNWLQLFAILGKDDAVFFMRKGIDEVRNLYFEKRSIGSD